jgi:hypothetical protein
MSKKMPRDIELINGELKNVLTREANDVVTVGNLLTEARSQIDHGHWLSWLEANFR